MDTGTVKSNWHDGGFSRQELIIPRTAWHEPLVKESQFLPGGATMVLVHSKQCQPYSVLGRLWSQTLLSNVCLRAETNIPFQ